MRQGADFLGTENDPDKTFRGTARRNDGPALRKISEEARTVRDLERSAHLTRTHRRVWRRSSSDWSVKPTFA